MSSLTILWNYWDLLASPGFSSISPRGFKAFFLKRWLLQTPRPPQQARICLGLCNVLGRRPVVVTQVFWPFSGWWLSSRLLPPPITLSGSDLVQPFLISALLFTFTVLTGIELGATKLKSLVSKSLFNQVGGCRRKEQNHLNMDDNSSWLHLYLWEIITLPSDIYSKLEDCHLSALAFNIFVIIIYGFPSISKELDFIDI